MTVEYKCTDVYKKPENPTEWLPCPRCGLRPLVWEFDNGRATACGCGTDCYSHWSVQAESIMSVIKRSDNGKSAEAYDIDELKNNWNHWVRTGEILFTPKFIDNMFGRENMISEGSTISENDTICINIKYHKIGEVFNYKVGMSEMTLRVDKCDRCSGCAFENYIYDCVKSGCLGCEREDGESVRYTIVNT